MILAYHFTGDALRDGRPLPPRGVWLTHDGLLIPCRAGLHASVHPFDAVQHAPGGLLHRVELDGDMLDYGDPPGTWCAQRRRIIATRDSTEALWAFARWCAVQVLFLWDAPAVVQAYLCTGDEAGRAAASMTAREAAQAAVLAAANAAANAAARGLASTAAWEAASTAAWGASWSAAWAAARAQAWAASTTIEPSNAVWATVRDGQRQEFLRRVEALFAEEPEYVYAE